MGNGEVKWLNIFTLGSLEIGNWTFLSVAAFYKCIHKASAGWKLWFVYQCKHCNAHLEAFIALTLTGLWVRYTCSLRMSTPRIWTSKLSSPNTSTSQNVNSQNVWQKKKCEATGSVVISLPILMSTILSKPWSPIWRHMDQVTQSDNYV